MKWLTLEAIKQHLRIDHDDEDALLQLYGEAAEDTTLNMIGRTYDDMTEAFGTDDRPVPPAIIQASLMLVETSYLNRGPVSQTNMYVVAYGFDALVAPFVKHTKDEDE